jgi:hypothetical protein
MKLDASWDMTACSHFRSLHLDPKLLFGNERNKEFMKMTMCLTAPPFPCMLIFIRNREQGTRFLESCTSEDGGHVRRQIAESKSEGFSVERQASTPDFSFFSSPLHFS